MGDARTRHIQAEASPGAKPEPSASRRFSRNGLLFDPRGGHWTGNRARDAAGVARPPAGRAGSARDGRARPHPRRDLGRDLHRRRLQRGDALALARRPRDHGGRLRPSLEDVAAHRRPRPRLRRRSSRAVRALLPDRALPLAGPGQLGRGRDHGHGEAVRDAARPRSSGCQLLPDAAGAALHRVGQARQRAGRGRPLPHAAAPRPRRAARGRGHVRALPAAHAPRLGLPGVAARRFQSRDVHDQPARDAGEHGGAPARRRTGPAPVGPPRESRARDLPRRRRRRPGLLRLLPRAGRVSDLGRLPDRDRARLPEEVRAEAARPDSAPSPQPESCSRPSRSRTRSRRSRPPTEAARTTRS